jgi:hypothetical protein
MRTCLATLLGLSLGLPPVAVAAPLPVGHGHASALPLLRLAAPDLDKPPEVLYTEGEKDYRLGKFSDALAKWEKGYELSERPLFLYNIALAYKGLYGISGNVDDLRKARAVMKNFLVLAEGNPDLDPEDAADRLAEIDGMIAEAQANAPKVDPDPVVPDPDPDEPVTPTGPDPGRTLRIAGASTLGVGGLFVVTGSVLGIYFGVRGQEFSDELRQLQADRGSVCDDDPDATACLQQDANIETARNNGRKANLGLGLALGIGGGLGLVALSAGAILFVQGNRRTAEWKRTGVAKHLRLVPMGRGLALQGRF